MGVAPPNGAGVASLRGYDVFFNIRDMYNTIRYKMAHPHPYHKMANNFKNCTKRIEAIDVVFNAANVPETQSANVYYDIYTVYAPKDKSCYELMDAGSFVDNMKSAAIFKNNRDWIEFIGGLWTDLYDPQNTKFQEKKIVIREIIETIEKQYNAQLGGGSSKKRASTHRRLKSRATSAARRRNRRRRTARK